MVRGVTNQRRGYLVLMACPSIGYFMIYSSVISAMHGLNSMKAQVANKKLFQHNSNSFKSVNDTTNGLDL